MQRLVLGSMLPAADKTNRSRYKGEANREKRIPRDPKAEKWAHPTRTGSNRLPPSYLMVQFTRRPSIFPNMSQRRDGVSAAGGGRWSDTSESHAHGIKLFTCAGFPDS
jgi:hypothetical protein